MRPQDTANQALPFASSYEPTAAAAPGVHVQVPVCILRTADGERQLLDCSILHQAGYKTRQSVSCIPDLVLTHPTLPAPLAVMLAPSTDPADSLDSAAWLQRCAGMAKTFRACCVALPVALGAHPAVLQLACDARFCGKLHLHYMCPGDDPAHTVLQLVSCCSNSPEAQQLSADAWNEVVALTTGPEAVEACVAALMMAPAAEAVT